MKILIVDDDESSRNYLERLLKSRGYAVETACDGPRGFEKALKAPPDLIISDILMPEMDGYELCRRLKAEERLRNIPVIFHTAVYGDRQGSELGLGLGASHFIVKPSRPQDLLAAVEEALGGAAAPRPGTEGGELEKEHLKVINDKFLLKVRELEEKQKELEKSEERFRVSFENAGVAECITGTDGRFIAVNRALCAMLGYDRTELLRHNFAEFTHPDDVAPSKNWVRQMLAGENAAPSLQKRYVHKNGSVIWAAVSTHLFREPGGAPLYFITEIQDVTGRKQAEEEKARLEERLLQAQKMEAVGRLAAGVAHDFNNILTAIAGYSGFLLRSLPPGGAQAADVAEIQKAADRASALTRQLLAFGRRQVLQSRVLDLNAVISGIKPMLARLIGENIELAADFSGDLRPVKADPGQLEQVIMNLAINARDAMPKGGKLTISTANAELENDTAGMSLGAPSGRYAVLAVSDTGLGMDRDTLSRVFEPFFTTKEKGRGTGLGLATVYGIVKQSGGDIHVYSEPGRGSVFKVYLPEAEGAVAEAAAAVPCRMPRGEGHILIVEDEEQVRKVAGRILAGHGYRVVEAASPQEAIGLCKRGGRFDLLLTDIVLPEMGGRELFERVSGLCPGIRPVFMSGYAGEALAETDLINGKAPFVQKPFTAEALLLVVGKALEERVPAGNSAV